jgi:uncharacterized membrane protein
MTERIVSYARISKDEPALMGVFLDFEMYAEPDTGHGYALSFDRKILGEFANSQDIELPDLAPGARKAWLEEQGLFEDFARFQEQSWRRRCRKLRRKVDAHNPEFQFCVYTWGGPPAGTLFVRKAAYPEWATQQAPLIRAESKTYGRSGPRPHAEALAANRETVKRRQMEAKAAAREYGVPVTYISGLDPIAPGADPEFCGKSAVMISEVADGYWVFYEGPGQDRADRPYFVRGLSDHKLYMHWFWWANRKIRQRKWKAADAPRETPDPYEEVTSIDARTQKTQVVYHALGDEVREQLAETGRYELHDLEGLSVEYLSSADLVILQNYNQDLPFEAATVQALRSYVKQGGGLMLTHDTAWYMASPVPEVARRDVPEHARHVESGRHVAEVDLKVTREHPAVEGVEKGTKFTPGFRDHMIFAPGPNGTVVVENVLGDPVYVIGEFGKGRVAFVGSYFGYREPLDEPETTLFVSLLDWLAR